MKYSQAILIACVGGAALGVSANPTGLRRGFALGKTAKLAGDVGNTAQPSNSQPAMMIARAAEAAATPDSAPAGGQGAAPDAAPQAPQKKLKKKKKHHKKRSGNLSPASDATPVARDFDEDLFIRGAMKGVKAGGKAAAKAAGGSTGIGSAAGGMFGAYTAHKAAKKAQAQQPPEERRDILSDFDDDLFTRGFGMKGITAGAKTASKAAGGSKGMKSAGKSMFNMFKGGNSQPDASQQAARRSIDVDEDLYSRIVIEPGTTMTTPELGGARYHVFRRNYDDELSARLFDNFRQKYREAKAARLQKEAAIAAAKADEGAVVARDGFNFYEIDELD